MRKHLSLLSAGLLVLSLGSCDFFDLTGDLRISSFSEAYSDASQIDPAIVVNAIVEITPAINDKTLFVTGPDGTLLLQGVPTGDYMIQPLYSPSSYQRQVTVEWNDVADITVRTPAWTILMYLINCATASPPLDSVDVRQALGYLIDRQAILSALVWNDCTPAASFIPEGLGDWSSAAAKVEYNTGHADSLLASVTPFSLTVTMANTTGATDYFTQVQPFLEAAGNVETVSSNPTATFDDLVTLLYAGGYQLLRMGWGFDSNNLLPFYQTYFGPGNSLSYSNSVVDSLLETGRIALAAGDKAAYEEAVVSINNELINDIPAIPLYWVH